MIYPPQEDSFLLQKFVKRYAKGFVLDLGTGSGIQAETAAKLKRVKKVIAADINPKAVAHCKKKAKKKITCRKTDLFSNIKEQFDTIIFNPPYLPQELPERDLALEGGKRGHETIEQFLESVNSHLKTDGNILLVFSSLTNKKKVEELIEKQLLSCKELGRVHVFFEDIFVYLLQKSALLKKIEKKAVKDVKYFARGRRGLIFTGKYKGKKVAIKLKHPKSTAKGRIKNEAKMLKVVNKLGIGPKLVLSNSFVAYEFVEGEYFADWLPKASKTNAKKAIKQLFDQAFKLDKAGIAKEEMLRPLKNAIVSKNKIVLIDFERAHKSKEAKNVTQLCQFVRNRRNLLRKKGIVVDVKALQDRAKHYKMRPTMGNLKVILDCVK